MGLRFCHRCRACSPAVRSSLAGIRRIAHTHVAWQVSPTGQLVIGVAGCTHTAAHFGVSRCASTYNMPCTCSRWAFAGCRQCFEVSVLGYRKTGERHENRKLHNGPHRRRYLTVGVCADHATHPISGIKLSDARYAPTGKGEGCCGADLHPLDGS